MSKLSPQQGQGALQEAVALHQQGQLAAAEKGYARVLKSFPDQFDALHLLGLLKLQSGKAGEAQRLIVSALKIAPNSPDAHANLGLVLGALKRPADALASFDKALALDANHFEALANRANVLLDLGRAEDALASLDKVLAREPRHLPSRVNRGNALLALGNSEAAIAEYDAALALNPNDLKALFNRANALFRVGRYADSLAGFDRLLALAPQHAEALSSRGLALQALGRHQDALASYAKAIVIAKDYVDAHFNEALALLTVGDYARGFAEYEWRWKRNIARRSFGKPLWRGEYPLGRKAILLHAEQGLGDTIQFARYAPLLGAGGARVVLEVQGELKALLAGLKGVTVLARGETLPAYDVHCPLGSLPLALKTTLDNVPAAIPYLRASEERIAKWRSRLEVLPAGLRVALAWAGNPAHINDRNRSVPLERLRPLLAAPGVNFISIQREVPARDRELLGNRALLTHLGGELADFYDTAAVIALCDRVITVDTSVAHLAGAMGRDTWILLPFWPDWRWTLTGDASPWYPDARLFRQGADGDWDPVIARIAAENSKMFIS